MRLSPPDVARIIYEASRVNRNRLFNDPDLAIDATPEDFKTTNAIAYSIDGVWYIKAATTGISFTAAHVVTAECFGAILVEIGANGTVDTVVGEATQTTPMEYATAEEAIAALPDASADHIALGYILIEAEVGNDWNANTDDMTAASDLTAATFVDYTLADRTDVGSSWEEVSSAYRDDRQSEVFAYVMSGSVPASVAAEVDPIIFQAVVNAVR